MSPIALPGSTELVPLSQGDLSNLCAVYSILNAVQLAYFPHKRLSKAHLGHEFRHGVEHLLRRKLLLPALKHGLHVPQWVHLAHAIFKHVGERHGRAFECQLVLHKHPRRDAAGALMVMEQHLQRGHPLLMGLWGTYSHYTVLSGVSDAKLTFFDSGGFKWVRRSCTSFMHDGTRRRHRIDRHSVLAVIPAV